jgi:predicted MFS family arabinose efflux permease
MPFGFGVMFGIGFIGRRFLARFGKFVLIAGSAILAVSCAAIFGWMFTGGKNLAVLVPALIAGGIGMGMLSGPIPPVTTARVDRAFAGAASGLLKTVQQVGAAVGVALAGSAYFAFFDQGLIAALAVIEALLIACALFSMRLRRDIFPPSAAKH